MNIANCPMCGGECAAKEYEYDTVYISFVECKMCEYLLSTHPGTWSSNATESIIESHNDLCARLDSVKELESDIGELSDALEDSDIEIGRLMEQNAALSAEVDRLKKWYHPAIVEAREDETYKCSEDCPYHGFMNDGDESPFCSINKASSEKVGPWGLYNLIPHPDCINANGDKGE